MTSFEQIQKQAEMFRLIKQAIQSQQTMDGWAGRRPTLTPPLAINLADTVNYHPGLPNQVPLAPPPMPIAPGPQGRFPRAWEPMPRYRPIGEAMRRNVAMRRPFRVSRVGRGIGGALAGAATQYLLSRYLQPRPLSLGQ